MTRAMACIRPAPCIGLVDVHRVHRRGVEAGQPHVADDDQLERIVRVLGARLEVLADVLGVEVRLERRRVGGRAGHDDLDLALPSGSSVCQSGRSATIFS